MLIESTGSDILETEDIANLSSVLDILFFKVPISNQGDSILSAGFYQARNSMVYPCNHSMLHNCPFPFCVNKQIGRKIILYCIGGRIYYAECYTSFCRVSDRGIHSISWISWRVFFLTYFAVWNWIHHCSSLINETRYSFKF